MVATRSPEQSRLPGSRPSRNSRVADIVKGLLALVVIAAIVVGVPMALYAGFGTPWPQEPLATDWIYTDFTPRDVLAVLVVVVWLAWLHFVICVLIELFAEQRGRGLAPHVPGGSVGTQPLARRLVGAVLLLSGGVAATLPIATAVTTNETQYQRNPVVTTAAQDAAKLGAAKATDRVSVEADPERAAFTERSGSVVHKYVEVQPPQGRNYDTLWGIAERYLGDGMRYKEIAALNNGVIQPDGTRLQNPDLIYPGWILKLPADAEGPGLRVADRPTADHNEPADKSGHKLGDRPDRDAGDRQGSTDKVDNAGGGAGDDGAGGIADNASVMAVGGFSAAGALLAAGLLYSLRRRRGWDGGPSPRGGKTLDHEFDMRASADESSAVFVDKVLRGLGKALPEGGSVPAQTSFVLGLDGLAITFAPESRVRLGSPWNGDPGGRTWTVRRTDAPTIKSHPADLSPLPGLVAIGHRDNAVETMLDIESIAGIVSLSGDLDVARDVAVGMGLGLATSRWSDRTRVTFVGFADDLSPLAPGSIRHYDDLTSIFEVIDVKRRRQHSACAANGYDSVRTGRLLSPDARLWAPEFIVVSGVPSAADVSRLGALAADPRSAVGVVVVGDVAGAPVRMVTSSEGRLWCGPLGIDVAGRRVTKETYRDALSVFDAEFLQGGGDDGPTGPDAPAGGIAAPVVDPDALDVTSRMAVEITTLGHLSVTGPGELDEARRDLLTELVVYLALHPDGIHPNVLAAAIWPRGVSDDVRDSALAQAANWLGTHFAGEPRLTIDTEGRWRINHSGVRVDWDVFRALANRSATGSDAIGDLELAMTLVTGPAWTGLPAGRYGWLAYETVEADVRVAVVAVARRLSTLAAAAGDAMRGRNALMAGLRLAPACEEIWRDALKLANEFAERADVRAVADDMYAAIARFGSPRGAEAETDALVDELLPGYRRSAA